ncbi:MAG: glycogen debranching enzyme N-terminal domain-containing protein [Holophagaceae bacterium]|uniref:Glycogen debranching enzyme N-terminal domain-containing protein n=1 Tax=Candidatus Geothrix skivensis TaxID=2954439 RepID=A0A9D7SKC6_9BACT|nr:glycogen debranching enzyme N-terminal domain-containing protein [Candidatus Geothrix skivensis]
MSQPAMTPPPGTQLLRFVGDRVVFTLAHPHPGAEGWRAFLRTNLTRGTRMREETLALAGEGSRDPAGSSWRDIPLQPVAEGWALDLALTEPGSFCAKAYCVDPEGRQHWPAGENLCLSIHPDRLRTANTIYCAFPRMFGGAATRQRPDLTDAVQALDAAGYAVIPPSGRLRDLTANLPHILERLGCRILHLLPVGPVPTTFARMGRFGSPYAQLDLTAIDPALVDFDQRTTGEEQFRELTAAVHQRGGQVILDILVNHTGWGSRLLENKPDWFRRNADGSFHSPGAWGNTWADLVELDHGSPALWDVVARSLLTWCERGVDGFRCDAGYMVPLPAWQYILAKVHRAHPETIFLLEGLGGAWEATQALLTRGGMQWAYSELFQNHHPIEVAHYLDHCLRQGESTGLLVHYSETHDNLRLAGRGAAWSLLRNRLCALAAQNGGFGFTAGVEWLATEKVDVHEARDLAWGAEPNLVAELALLNRLLAEHPCFFDGAEVRRLSPEDASVLALARTSAEGLDQVLILANLDLEKPQACPLRAEDWVALGEAPVDLLGQPMPASKPLPGGGRELTLAPGACHCLSAQASARGLAGEAYRNARAQAAWALQALAAVHPAEALGPAPWRDLARRVAPDPEGFLAALPHLDGELLRRDLLAALEGARALPTFPQVTTWRLEDARRISLVPPCHWLLLLDAGPFQATLRMPNQPDLHLRGVPMETGFVAAIPPQPGRKGDGTLLLHRHRVDAGVLDAALRFLPEAPELPRPGRQGLALLTNGRGGMARLAGDLGAISSKYDCLLGANLHPAAPSDRHVLAKRLRAWVNADGFITALDGHNLVRFEAGPTARWTFRASAGDGRWVELGLEADMLEDQNAVRLRWSRPAPPGGETDLLPGHLVRVTVRVDLEDRSFHGETRLDGGLEGHFQAATQVLEGRTGFRFAPAPGRHLEVWASAGDYHPQPEACRNLPHPVEGSRGMAAAGDAWSPGWFDLPLPPGSEVRMLASAEAQAPLELPLFAEAPAQSVPELLERSLRAFLARREEGLTVIAGYPWFLDWGRDTLIACRGLLASGQAEAAGLILRTYATLEEGGTLPNMLGAESTADRDTSDAPLWLAVACEEAAEHLGAEFLQATAGERSVLEVLTSLGEHLRAGARNGVRMDPASGLLWSPAHFTWMDTRYPMGSPREGYPVEIQALWIRLLRLLAWLGAPSDREPWAETVARAEASLETFWLEDRGWFADVLLAADGVPAAKALPADHLRPNQLLLISLGLVTGDRARRAVAACARHLLVPGGLRSLAPLPVSVPLPIPAPWGGTLNDPRQPYQGRYDGDEDTRRKPAYHNGTAWVWQLPLLCEALDLAWEGDPAARATAKAWLGTVTPLLGTGCLGQLPELLDGDAPHTPRGCDAQAWSVSEALRVWLQLA